MGRKRRGPRRAALDAYLTFAIFAVVGVATWRLDQLLRLTLMWLALLILTIAYAPGRKIQFGYRFSDLARGIVTGLLISLPVALLARDFLLATSKRLFPLDSSLILFWALVLIMPVIEALYFRGFVQGEKGLLPAVLLYAGAAAPYFLPFTLGDYVPVLAALVAGMGLLGFVYSYVRSLYGFGASLACQSVVHFVLFVLPLLPQEFAGLVA